MRVLLYLDDSILQEAVKRILIVDWDVHHGNGTHEVFYEDERVFFYQSIGMKHLFYFSFFLVMTINEYIYSNTIYGGWILT